MPYAAQLVLEEINKIREQPATAEELDTIKRSLIETFPSNFESKAKAVALFAADEYTRPRPVVLADLPRPDPGRDRRGRPARGAQAPAAGEAGRSWWWATRRRSTSATERRASSLAALAPGGHVVTLPLRDPMTMKLP